MTCSGCYQSFSGPWCDNCDQWPCRCPDAGYRLVSEADLARALREIALKDIEHSPWEQALEDNRQHFLGLAQPIFAALGTAQEKGT